MTTINDEARSVATHVVDSASSLRPPASSRALGAPLGALRAHWPEYLIEGWALGMFMISAGVFATLLDYPGSPVHLAVAEPLVRRVLIGLAMGITAIALIYSPWGQRSGAHMNPAVTLAFLRLGKIDRWDAIFFIAAQFIGGTLGVVVVAAALAEAFTGAPVRYAATLPGPDGELVAFVAELLISALLIFVVLTVSNSTRWAKLTGICAGILVATYISVEAPFSGMSMNPARSFASAMPGGIWMSFWVYVLAPVIGMQLGVGAYLTTRGRDAVGCAKLIHPDDQRCIHCGFDPHRQVIPEA